MERSWIYRVVTYALITVLSVVVLVPSVADWTGRGEKLPGWFTKTFNRKIALGLDLQGGLHLVYEVQVDKAVTDKADRLATQIEEKLIKDRKAKGVKATRLGTGAEAQLKVVFENKGDLKKIDGQFSREFARYLTEERDLLAAVHSLTKMRGWRSIYRMVAGHLRHPKLRIVMSFHPLLIGGSPLNVSSAYALIHTLERRFGVLFQSAALFGSWTLLVVLTFVIVADLKALKRTEILRRGWWRAFIPRGATRRPPLPAPGSAP